MASTVREVTYDLLRGLGLNVIFGNPGSSELPFLKDLPSDFRYILGLHERTAAGMALGYSVATGKAAFVNLHSIASAGNGLSAIIDAYYCHAPLVITTGQQDRRQVLAEPFLVSRAVEVVKPYEVGLRAAVRGGCACGDCARILPGDAAAARPGVHLHSHGRLESSLRGVAGAQSEYVGFATDSWRRA